MKNLILLILMLGIMTQPIMAQKQLVVEGNDNSVDTVATIKANYDGSSSDEVVGLYVKSVHPNGLQGIGGTFEGGVIGLIGLSETGTGIAGDSKEGVGVTGIGSDTSSLNTGVWGITNSFIGRGVHGFANNFSGGGLGVYGESQGEFGTGVIGSATHLTGITFGTVGRSHSPDGIGMSAENNSTTGKALALRALSTSARAMVCLCAGLYAAFLFSVLMMATLLPPCITFMNSFGIERTTFTRT